MIILLIAILLWCINIKFLKFWFKNCCRCWLTMNWNLKFIVMGNSEGGQSRNPARAVSASDSARQQSKSPKVKSPTSQSVSPWQKLPSDPSRRTVFYENFDSNTDTYHTCKPGFDTGTHSEDIPAYYLTESQLFRSKGLSKSHDADLDRTPSLSQEADVRHIARSSLNGNYDASDVSAIFYAIW